VFQCFILTWNHGFNFKLINETAMYCPLVNVFQCISSIVKYNTSNKWKLVKLMFRI